MEEWLMARPYSYWDVADVRLSTDAWPGLPKLSVNRLQPHVSPLENAELVFMFLSFVASPAAIRNYAKAGGLPPPQTPPTGKAREHVEQWNRVGEL